MIMLTGFAHRTPDIALPTRRHAFSTLPCPTATQQPATPCCRHDASGAAAPSWPSQAVCAQLRSSTGGRLGHGRGRRGWRQRLRLSAAAVADSALQLPGAQLDRVRTLRSDTALGRRLQACATVVQRQCTPVRLRSGPCTVVTPCWHELPAGARCPSSANPLPSCCAVNGGLQVRRVISFLSGAHAGSRRDCLQLSGSRAGRCALRNGQGAPPAVVRTCQSGKMPDAGMLSE